MENEIRYSQGGETEGLVFKNENPNDQYFGTTFYVEQMPNGIWSIYSENPKWEKRLEYEYGFASKEDAIDIAKINADIMNEDDPESYFMSREFGDGGSLEEKPLKGYRVRIFRSDISTSSSNILNSENSAILVTNGMSGDSSTILASEPHLKLIKRNIFGKTVLSAEPVNYGHESKSKMFGGSFIWSTDSRFRNDVSENPIALHDRVEYKKGGNLDSDIQSKIDKLEKVVNSTMIPDSIKEKARLEIENLKSTTSEPATSSVVEQKGLSAEQRELNKKVLALVKKNNIESAYDFQSLVGMTLEDSNYHEVFFRFAKLIDPTIKTKENWYRSTEFDGNDSTRDIAVKISQLCSYDLNMIAPAFEFVLKMSGRQNIADKLDKAIRNQEVETPATQETSTPAKKIKKGTLSEMAIYVPKRSIESLSVTIDGQKYSFSNDDIIDGIYVLKTSLKDTPKVTRTQFEEEEFKVGKDDFSFLLKLSDKELVERLDLIRKQQVINGKQYLNAKKNKQSTSKIEESGDNLAKQERAIIEARLRKNKFAKGGGVDKPSIGSKVYAYFASNYMGEQLVNSPAMGEPYDGKVIDIVNENGLQKYVIEFENGETKKLSQNNFDEYVYLSRYAKGGGVDYSEFDKIEPMSSEDFEKISKRLDAKESAQHKHLGTHKEFTDYWYNGGREIAIDKYGDDESIAWAEAYEDFKNKMSNGGRVPNEEVYKQVFDYMIGGDRPKSFETLKSQVDAKAKSVNVSVSEIYKDIQDDMSSAEDYHYMKNGGGVGLTLKESENDLKNYLKTTPVKIDFGGYDQFDGENVIFVHYKEKDEAKVEDLLNSWVSKHSWKNTINVYQAVDNFSNKESYWTYVIEETEQMAEGGNIKWSDAVKGDSALVVSENKMGMILKDYGRKFHLRFGDGSEKTYDASELKFYKLGDDDYAKGGYLVKYGSSNENKGGQTIIKTKDEVDSFVKVLKEKGHNDIEINEKYLSPKNSENQIEIAENKGDGKLINNLFNAYKSADTPKELKKWETKVRNSSLMFERNLIKERLSKVEFDKSKISNDELNKFKNKIISIIERKHAWELAKGGYTEPANDLPIRGKYKFVTKDGKEFMINVTRYERENDLEDSLVISQDQDKFRGELGSIIIKNSAWRNLTKLGKTIMARASKGSIGKITKINDTLAKGGMATGWSHKKK
jgi:hypothetical protein